MKNMKKTLTLITASVLLAAGGAALAAAPAKATKAECDSLIKQFDGLVAKHSKSPDLMKAKEMRAEAEKSCKSGDYAKGVADVHAALKDLGETPAKK